MCTKFANGKTASWELAIYLVSVKFSRYRNIELQTTDFDSSLPHRLRVSVIVAHAILATFSESELGDRQVRALITASARRNSTATVSNRWHTTALAYLAVFKKATRRQRVWLDCYGAH